MKQILLFILMFSSQARQLDFSFLAKTNMPGISVEGKSTKPVSLKDGLEGQVEIDIKNISTDMELRDEHMREDIFKNKNIFVKFSDADCLNKAECTVGLKIKINEQEVEKKLNLKKEGDEYKGSLTLKLSEFKIEEPSKFGVKVHPDVELKVNVKN